MSLLAVDSHVHLHPGVPLDAALDAAAANLPPADLRLLCLTDAAGQDSAARLRAHPPGRWRVTETEDGFLAAGPDGAEIHLWPGRQIVSSDGLELLALGLRGALPDRTHALADLLPRAAEAGAVPVLPWGVGKWCGARGKIVAGLLEGGEVILADNGNRLRGTPEPALLSRARARGLPVLFGSDPLPFPGTHRRIGACGNRVKLADTGSLTERLRAALRRPGDWKAYGRFTPMALFLRQQVGMQARKFLVRKVPG